jgi:hypothetical protein
MMRRNQAHNGLGKGCSSQWEEQVQSLEVGRERSFAYSGSRKEFNATAREHVRASSGVKWGLVLVDYGNKHGFYFKINEKLVEGFKPMSAMI